MRGRSRVALVRCAAYRPEEVEEAFAQGVRLLGGWESILAGRRTVLLKPNLLHGDPPERGSITHPSVLRAAARACRAHGLDVSYGDSPAFQNPRTAARASGYEAVAAETMIRLGDFENGEEVGFPDGRQNKVFFLARAALEADAIVNLPKMKTHGLTRMSGAIKNLYGIIPGLRKSWFHARLSDERSFSRMLVDLNRLKTPALSVMDAIEGMEGNGPRSGGLVRTGLLIFSADPTALDATACRVMGIRPEEVFFLTHAESLGFGRVREEEIEIVGESLERARGRPYALHPPSAPVMSKSPLLRHVKRLVVPRPEIEAGRCTRCLQCVRICPVEPKALSASGERPPRFDYDRCIRCYCCQETCPEGAIRIRVPLMGRLFHGRTKRF